MFLTADLWPEVEMMAMLAFREDGHECSFKALFHQETEVLLFQTKFKVIINLFLALWISIAYPLNWFHSGMNLPKLMRADSQINYDSKISLDHTILLTFMSVNKFFECFKERKRNKPKLRTHESGPLILVRTVLSKLHWTNNSFSRSKLEYIDYLI